MHFEVHRVYVPSQYANDTACTLSMDYIHEWAKLGEDSTGIFVFPFLRSCGIFYKYQFMAKIILSRFDKSHSIKWF